MQIVIDIPDRIYKISQNRTLNIVDDEILEKAVKNGTPLPTGHGRLIDADAFISLLEDASKRNKYKELLIDDCLTVDDVFKAVIKSLQNKGLTKYDAPTIIEADKAESEE